MSFEYSENILVQNSAANLLEKELGWEVVFAYNAETLGEGGSLGRSSYKDIVLVRYLRKALFENNDWLSPDLCGTNDETKKKFEIMARELFKLFKYVGKDDLGKASRANKNAISAIYDQLQEKRDKSDISKVMIALNAAVSRSISVKRPEQIAESKRFDISKIDFERLRQEFVRVKNKNLLVKDLKDMVEEKLEKMMRNLAIYDLLLKEKLSPQEIKKIKALSHTLLETVKAKLKELDNWRDKDNTNGKLRK